MEKKMKKEEPQENTENMTLDMADAQAMANEKNQKPRKKPVRIPLEKKGILGKIILALRAVKVKNANTQTVKNFGVEVIATAYRTEEGLFDLPQFKADFIEFVERTKGVGRGIPVEPIEL